MPASRPALSLAALTAAAALALSGCSSDPEAAPAGGSGSSAAAPSATPSPSSTVAVPDAVTLTDQGSTLSFGAPATVIFEPTQQRGTVLKLTVLGVRAGRLADFRSFLLDDTYKRKADYYYARVRVQNVGEGDVGGVPVPLWGVNRANTLLPPVSFTTTFPTCPTKPLPAKFGPGTRLDTCLVFLSPNRGGLESVSYRPSQEFDPVTWTGTIQKPAATAKKKNKKPRR